MDYSVILKYSTTDKWIDTARAAGREIPTPTFGQDNF